MNLIKRCPTDGLEYPPDHDNHCEVCFRELVLWCKKHRTSAVDLRGCVICKTAPAEPIDPPVAPKSSLPSRSSGRRFAATIATGIVVVLILVIAGVFLTPPPLVRSPGASPTPIADRMAPTPSRPLLANRSSPATAKPTPATPGPIEALDVPLPGERYPQTRTRALEEADVRPWTAEQIRYAINEMYARHGADFRDPEVTSSFKQFSWYRPKAGANYEDTEKSFTSIETENLKVLGFYRSLRKAGVAPTQAKPRVSGEVVVAVDPGVPPANSFPVSTPILYAFFKTAGTQRGDKLTGVWIAEAIDTTGRAETRIRQETLTAVGSDFSGAFTASRPATDWPPGGYRVEIYHQESLITAVRFMIGRDPASSAKRSVGGSVIDTVGTLVPSTNQQTYRVVGLPKSTPFLNVRSGPGTNFPVVAAFTPQGRGIILGPGRRANGPTIWQEVISGPYRGWVNAEYLAVEDPGPRGGRNP